MVEEEELLLHYLGDLSELQRLTLIWTAKEAAKKALSHSRMPGFLELILTEAEPHTGGWLVTFLVSSREYTRYPATVTVAAELYAGYGLALCLTGENIDA
jgi:4'-phosphopantetheinyl transferase EntD